RVAACVVADGGADLLRYGLDRPQHVLDRPIGPLGAVERLVRVVDVGLVVLVVVDLHRLRVDRAVERVGRIWQGWYLVRHVTLLGRFVLSAVRIFSGSPFKRDDEESDVATLRGDLPSPAEAVPAR